MSFTLALFIYLLIWWVTLFIVLPFGVNRHTDSGKGFDEGAPAVTNLKKKLIINTILAGVILGVIYVLVEMDIISWQTWFDGGIQP